MPSVNGAVILVVEDDVSIRQLMVWMLEDQGFKVASAANGREALERARALLPSVVILDLGLPIMDGVRVSAGLRRSDGEAPAVIVVSADREAADKAEAIGATALITKPFDIDALIRTVWRAVEARSSRHTAFDRVRESSSRTMPLQSAVSLA